ncbi:MAG: hypothetical protein K2P59_05595 [Acetatifactor sp.]|nr:hypothetical protein [Acetatifactor sp.]
MASAIENTERYVASENCSYQDAAIAVVGADELDFSHIDMCADADAIKIAELISASTSRTHSFSEALRNYYDNYAGDRFRYLIDDIGCKANITDIEDKLINGLDVISAEVAWTIGQMIKNPPSSIEDFLNRLKKLSSSDAYTACCTAFAHYLYCELE